MDCSLLAPIFEGIEYHWAKQLACLTVRQGHLSELAYVPIQLPGFDCAGQRFHCLSLQSGEMEGAPEKMELGVSHL
jgi:hypothetical protein